MIKVLGLIAPTGSARSLLMRQFFDMMPVGFQEVFDPLEADVFFVHVNPGGKGADIYIEGMQENNLRFDLNSINVGMIRKLEAVLQIPGILYFDSFGAARSDNQEYPHFVRDMDIPTAAVELPDHPNFYRTHFVDERRFYVSHRYIREAKHLLILPDHIVVDGIAEALVSLLKKEVIARVIVPGGGSLSFIEETYGGDLKILESYQEEIQCISRVPWSDGVCELLNSVGFYLSAQPGHGVELMGVEAGMCGAQPVYPDVPYYRDMFAETDVVFFDIETPIDSLDEILGEGFNWGEEKRERFMDRCSGVRNLPKFWEHVKRVVENDIKV